MEGEFETVLTTRKELLAKVSEGERLLSPWEPESERARLWEWKNRLTSLEVLQGRCYTEAYRHYQQALGYDSGAEGATNGLLTLLSFKSDWRGKTKTCLSWCSSLNSGEACSEKKWRGREVSLFEPNLRVPNCTCFPPLNGRGSRI